MVSALAAAAAVIVLAVVLQDAFEVMLLPRRVFRRVRLTRFYFAASWSAWTGLARHIAEGARRERFLGLFGALAMIVLFGLWAASLILGFGTLEWALRAAGCRAVAAPSRST